MDCKRLNEPKGYCFYRNAVVSLLAIILSGLHPACAETRAGSSPSCDRIASLAPSNTELIYSLGAQDKLVGVSTFCDYPGHAKRKEKVGSFVSVNLERLARLKPDAVLLVDGQESMAGTLRRQGYRVILLNNTRLDAISKNIVLIGTITGKRAESERLALRFERQLAALRKIISQARSKPKVFYCVWPKPLLTAGQSSFLNGVITTCGGKNIAANLKAAYPQFGLERLMLSNPDLIIFPGESRDAKYLARPPWSNLQAVRNNRVYFLPEASHDNLARPTLRVTQGLFWLSSTIHPELNLQLEKWLKECRNEDRAALSGESVGKMRETSGRK